MQTRALTVTIETLRYSVVVWLTADARLEEQVCEVEAQHRSERASVLLPGSGPVPNCLSDVLSGLFYH